MDKFPIFDFVHCLFNCLEIEASNSFNWRVHQCLVLHIVHCDAKCLFTLKQSFDKCLGPLLCYRVSQSID